MKKKKVLALLLTAALVATLPGAAVSAETTPAAETTEAAPAAAEESEPAPAAEDAETTPAEESTPAEAEETAALPSIGDTLHGFTVTEIRDFPLMDAEIVQFVHDRTGAELYYIANDDNNRLFDLTFFTRAYDNTGLPHVFEHSTLDGSEKYPSKSLFFNLSYQTYQTFMNAMTYPLMTTYPVASLSEEQLLRLADYYTDSCLNPMIMTDESIYREEAWRYRLMDKDADLTIEGTVYSEMQGAVDLHSMALTNFLNTVFPGSFIGNESGGLPEYIPDMTYESLRDFHNKYYTPSNCAAFLYGQFDHYEEFLALLDEAFAPFEKVEIIDTDENYKPLESESAAEYAFAAEASSDTKNGSDVYYGIICPEASEEDILVLDNLLTLLLDDDASPLIQKLQQVLPSGDFNAYLELEGPEPAFVFSAQNVDRESADVFKETVDQVLKDLAANGFSDELVESVAASEKLSNALSRESASVGVDVVIPMFAYNYSISGDPWYYLDCVETIEQMEEYHKDGRIQEVLGKYLSDPQRTALSTTYPEPGLKEQQDEALAEKLAAVKASMTDEEIAALVEASNAQQEEDDASQYIAQISTVSVDELPEETQEYPITDETGEDGFRHLSSVAPLDGVSYGALFLDTSAISQEDLLWYSLYSGLYTKLDSNAHTREELASLMSRYLYNLAINVNGIDNYATGEFTPCLNVSWIALDEDIPAGYDLVYELLFDLKLDDVQLLTDAVNSTRTTLKNEITQAPYNLQLFRGFARTSEMYRYMNYMRYLDYYDFLGEVEAMLQQDPGQVTARLESIRDQLHNAYGAATAAIGNAESIAIRQEQADAFLKKLDNQKKEAAVYDLPVPAASEGIILDSSVQYNGYVADYPALGLDNFTGDLDGVTALVLDTYLYPMLRDAYGVYGILHAAMVQYGAYEISYRDTNLKETYDVYGQLAGLIAEKEIDQETLNGYILSSYSGYALSQGVLTTAAENLNYYMSGLPEGTRIKWMQELKALTPEKLKACAEIYDNMVKNGYKTSSGGAGVINANADQFEVILNPFGAADTSQVEFTDLPEDSEYYEAVRFMFENGMMDPEADDSFGVESQATAGDLAGGLFVMLGGYPHAQEDAVAQLSQMGLFPADLAVDTPLTQETADNVINSLLAAAGAAAPETADAGNAAGEDQAAESGGEIVTRGELALALYALVNME